MRYVSLHEALPHSGQEERVARLTRHLAARLRDFGPGGPEVLSADQQAGRIEARFPGHDTGAVLDRLEKRGGVTAGLEGDRAVFLLSPHTRFEDLDYVWGCLFELLG